MTKKILAPAGLLIMALAANTAFAESDPPKPAKTKRVFTNEDLSKFSEKFGHDPQPAQVSGSKNTLETQSTPSKQVSERKGPNGDEQARWAGKLKEAETAVQKAKADQAKYASALEDFEQRRQKAQTDFQKTLTEHQVADSQKNLARATDEVRQAEEMKAKLLADAAQKGFKPGDLIEGAGPTGSQK